MQSGTEYARAAPCNNCEFRRRSSRGKDQLKGVSESSSFCSVLGRQKLELSLTLSWMVGTRIASA
jgi:hypothetical protein